MKKIFIVDIDGTICEDIKNEEGSQRMLEAAPFKGSIEAVNRWHDEGHFICFFTARTNEHRAATEQWMMKNGVKYHQIIYNKPRKISPFSEYHFIDNAPIRATKFSGKMTPKFVKQIKEIEVFED
jgi:uncharacterized HAD superfamily protein